MQVLHDVLATRLEVRKKRDPVTDGLEIINAQRHINGAGHGKQVQDRVGRTTQGHHNDQGILKRGTCHDVTGLDVLLKQVTNSAAGVQALGQLARIHSRR